MDTSFIKEIWNIKENDKHNQAEKKEKKRAFVAINDKGHWSENGERVLNL